MTLNFIVFLKKNLPKGFQIIAEPSSDYYSEWNFKYILLKNGKIFKEFHGNFKDIRPGTMITEAKHIIKKVVNEEDYGHQQ